jgi:hypothetical protein
MQRPQFTIGRVLAQVISLWRPNFVPYLGIIVVSAILVTLARFWIDTAFWPHRLAMNTHDALGFALGVVVNAVETCLFGGFVAYVTLARLNGHPAKIGPALARSWRTLWRALPIILPLAFYWEIQNENFKSVAGWLLFLSNFIFDVAFWTLTPAIAWEEIGCGAGYRRTIALLRGNSWRVLGLVLLSLVFSVVVGVGQTLLIPAHWSLSIANFEISGRFISYWTLIVVIERVMDVMSAVSYFYMRIDKEGYPVADIAVVFD